MVDTRGEADRQEDQREGRRHERERVGERAEKKSDEDKGGWQFHYENDR